MLSVADELEKLAELQARGILSLADFEGQKARLLTGDESDDERAPGPTKKPAEKVFFKGKNGAVRVSSLRVVIHERTFATQNISSVAMEDDAAEINLKRRMQILGALILLGLPSLFSFKAGLDGLGYCILFFALVVVVHALLLRVTYFVVVTGGGGDTLGLKSHKREFIERIVGAIDEAITWRQ